MSNRSSGYRSTSFGNAESTGSIGSTGNLGNIGSIGSIGPLRDSMNRDAGPSDPDQVSRA